MPDEGHNKTARQELDSIENSKHETQKQQYYKYFTLSVRQF